VSGCTRVRPSVRRAELTFTHHDFVAKLKPNEQRHWLAEAVRNGWSADELRDQVNPDRVLPAPVNGHLPSIVKDALSGAREMMDGWWITRDSYVRLRAAVGGEDGNET